MERETTADRRPAPGNQPSKLRGTTGDKGNQSLFGEANEHHLGNRDTVARLELCALTEADSCLNGER
jgi:hypothetical protein